MLGAHRMLVLVLERAQFPRLATGPRQLGAAVPYRHVLCDNTPPLYSLRTGGFMPAAKSLVVDFASVGVAQLDNLEGMCWGPQTAGRRTLWFVSD